MEFQYNDGGRAEAGYKGSTKDCACRAIAIGTGLPYKTVYDGLTDKAKEMGKRYPSIEKYNKKNGYSPRKSTNVRVFKAYMEDLGWTWVPTMGVGTGCKVHVNSEDLPSSGRLILRVTRHVTCVIDGVLNDTFDCSRGGTRCVYGYWRK